MIVARLQASGPAVPSCLPADVEVFDGNGQLIEPLREGLHAYGSDAERLTHAIYLPGLYPQPGQPIQVTASSLGASAKVALVVVR